MPETPQLDNIFLKDKTITFIGAGNMGSALIGGLIAAGHAAGCIWATEPQAESLQRIKQLYDICISQDNTEGVEQADIVILAVKPQVIDAVLEGLQAVVQRKKPLVVSIVAGTPESALQKKLGGGIAIVRTMPNTPALIGYGATVMYANSLVTSSQKQMAQAIFAAVGQDYWLEDESHLEAVSALSGSGPAYFFMLMEALQEAAIGSGLPADLAAQLTAQTALGSAYMALKTEMAPAQLRKQVTSPGGGTEQAMKVFDADGFKELVAKAFNAAKQQYELMVAKQKNFLSP